MNIDEIPSDSESIDGLVDSDLDDNELDFETENEFQENETSNDSDEDEVEHSGGEVWKKRGKYRDDDPFTADFGPNIPDNIKSPLDIFLCLFPEDMLNCW